MSYIFEDMLEEVKWLIFFSHTGIWAIYFCVNHKLILIVKPLFADPILVII